MNIPKFKVEKLVNKPGNEMWRIGGGFHAYRGFFRIDMGSVAYRIIRDFDYYQEFTRLYNLLTDENQHIVHKYINELAAEQNNDSTIETSVVSRGGSLMRERDDLPQKVWSRTRELLRSQRTMH